MKTKVIISSSAIVILAIIVAVLFNNKANSIKSVKSNEFIFYPVSVIQVAKENLEEPLSFTGTINAYNDVTIVSETSGKVVEVYAEIGNFKSAGSPIAKVDDELKKASFQLAEANYNKAKKDLERFKTLYSNSTASDQQMEGAQLAYQSAEAQYTIAKRQLNDTKITTPISGVITSRSIEVGTMVNNGMPVANVANISQLKVKLNLSESDAFKVKVGDPVNVTTDVYPERTFAGKIKSISDKSDDMHAYPVEIVINNDKQYPLRAGMFGRVSFNSKLSGNSIVIPREALLGSTRNPQVYVVKDNIAKLKDIELGIEIGTKTQVLKGLEEGEILVTNGHNNLKDGFKVTIIK